MIPEDEIVYELDMSKSPEEIEEQVKRNTAAKLRHAERKEEEWLAKDHKFLDAIIDLTLAIEKLVKKALPKKQKSK